MAVAMLVWVGAPAFIRGKERFSAPGDVRLRSCALAPGWRNPGAKAQLKNGTFFPWTEVQFPLLKQGAATKSLHEFFTTSEGRIYRQLSHALLNRCSTRIHQLRICFSRRALSAGYLETGDCGTVVR